jgi:hypothetical protein
MLCNPDLSLIGWLIGDLHSIEFELIVKFLSFILSGRYSLGISLNKLTLFYLEATGLKIDFKGASNIPNYSGT